ncbi:MAG TPA: PDZ domain-containing protein [Thermoanaerobaculia bacterium]|nr:PDZ domain-containing protein [Thermoanaerobaculia bacterium]
MRLKRIVLTFVSILLLATAVFAADPIRITVDATDAPHDVLHSRVTIPAAAGPLALFYPKWIPGEHGPTGPIIQSAGLRVTSGGQTLHWSRDQKEMYELHVDVPKGANDVTVEMDFLDPVGSGQFSGGGSMTPQLAMVSWNALLWYPAAKSSDDLRYEATLRVPNGWKYATALTTTATNGNEIRFEPVTLTNLVDSPVLIGSMLRKIDLPSSSPFRHTIDIAADSEAATVTPADFVAMYGRLVDEARALFGAEHFRHYDWLVTLSDNVQHFGLEHHQSSDDRTSEDILSEENKRRSLAGLLAHEYVHSWNGKHRRPAGLATANYELPMTGELLWVYEGLTHYLGKLLPYRSGLWTPEFYRDSLALTASDLSSNAGRSWRPLEDTAVEAQLLYGAPRAWSAYRRSVDFYEEGVLLWLDADMTIRKLTGNKRSLDDFCRRFHGGADGDPIVKTYTFDDVVRTLNDVAPYDWASFLNQRLRSTTSAPLGGIEASGWRLVYNDQPNPVQEAGEKRDKAADYSTSLGFWINDEGRISDVVPGSPAAKAGIVPGARLIGVNGRRYTSDLLKIAVRDSKNASSPMQVVYGSGEFVRTASIDYRGGLRYAHLERIPNTPDWLAELGKPLAAKK